MRRFLITGLALAAGATFLTATPAAAQNAQTWVSSGGSDANACTRAAPCATFTAALAVTNSGGQINCADRANYGAVTIGKAVTIECDVGSIVVTSGAAVTVAAGSSDVVTIRGLQLDGALASSGNGITVTSASKLILDGVTVANFLGNGIAVTPTSNVQLILLGSNLANNGSASAAAALLVQPGAVSVTVSVALDRSNISGNSVAAMRIKTTSMTGGGVSARVRQATIASNAFGVVATAGASAAIAVTVEDSDLTRNTNHALAASGSMAQIMAFNNAITGNGLAAVSGAGGSVLSTGDNLVYDNTTNGFFSGSVTIQ